MAEVPTDPYHSWRANLREVLKWYVAALVGLGALLASGLTLAVLPGLQGGSLYFVAVLGAIVIVLLLRGIWNVHLILFIRPFPRTRLECAPENDALRRKLAPHLATMLPGQETWLSQVQVKGRALEETDPDLRALDRLNQARKDARDDKSVSAADYNKLENTQFKINSFASYLDLEERVRILNADLMISFVVAVAFTAFLTVYAERNKTAEPAMTEIVFDPGGSTWWSYASRLQAACGVGPFDSKGRPSEGLDGWWTITLEGPDCKGVTLSVPNAVVQASSSASQ
ncbi:MAG: hypothetical protein AAF230_09730 [Pseudomonadota bacterium]